MKAVRATACLALAVLAAGCARGEAEPTARLQVSAVADLVEVRALDAACPCVPAAVPAPGACRAAASCACPGAWWTCMESGRLERAGAVIAEARWWNNGLDLFGADADALVLTGCGDELRIPLAASDEAPEVAIDHVAFDQFSVFLGWRAAGAPAAVVGRIPVADSAAVCRGDDETTLPVPVPNLNGTAVAWIDLVSYAPPVVREEPLARVTLWHGRRERLPDVRLPRAADGRYHVALGLARPYVSLVVDQVAMTDRLHLDEASFAVGDDEVYVTLSGRFRDDRDLLTPLRYRAGVDADELSIGALSGQFSHAVPVEALALGAPRDNRFHVEGGPVMLADDHLAVETHFALVWDVGVVAEPIDPVD